MGIVDKVNDKIYGNIYSDIKTPPDFYYEHLTTIPIGMLLSPDDVAELHRIATSVLYCGNPSKRRKARNAVMESRGFIPYDGGTNRSIYIHASTPNVVYKVAIDIGGIEDNFAEFKNQEILKPFCTKTFEVTHCGTVISQEMVNSFKSQEQMEKYSKGIFWIINYCILPKYIMTDIGVSVYKNWGIRPGSFPVLLDYTTIYEVDGNKLICDKPLDNGKICGGHIDYNDGYDFLICKKCGRKYRVKEVAKDKDHVDDFIGDFIGSKGEDKMKISIVNATTGDVMANHNVGGETDFLKNKKSPVVKEHRKTPLIGIKMIDGPGKKADTNKKADPIKKVELSGEKKESIVTKDSKKTPIQTVTINVNLKEAKPSGIISDELDAVKPSVVFAETVKEVIKEEVKEVKAVVEEAVKEDLPKSEDEALDIAEDLTDPVVEEAKEEEITSDDIMNIISNKSDPVVEETKEEEEETTTVYSDTQEVTASVEEAKVEEPVAEEKPKKTKKSGKATRDSKGKFVKAEDIEEAEELAPVMKQKKRGKKSIADELANY